MASTDSACYSDIRLTTQDPPGTPVADPQTYRYSLNSYKYECRGDKQMVYTSYPRTAAGVSSIHSFIHSFIRL